MTAVDDKSAFGITEIAVVEAVLAPEIDVGRILIFPFWPWLALVRFFFNGDFSLIELRLQDHGIARPESKFRYLDFAAEVPVFMMGNAVGPV